MIVYDEVHLMRLCSYNALVWYDPKETKRTYRCVIYIDTIDCETISSLLYQNVVCPIYLTTFIEDKH